MEMFFGISQIDTSVFVEAITTPRTYKRIVYVVLAFEKTHLCAESTCGG
jgi:hypothetical protein